MTLCLVFIQDEKMSARAYFVWLSAMSLVSLVESALILWKNLPDSVRLFVYRAW